MRRLKNLLKAVIIILLCANLISLCNVYATETEAVNQESTDGETPLNMVVDGNTVYVDAKGTWSTIQGSIAFDASHKVKEHGVTEELQKAVSKQLKIGFPVENLLEDEYVFVGVYTSITGEGIDYTGHTFYLTFEDTTTPITVTLKDIGGTVIETAVVDGTTLPPLEKDASLEEQEDVGKDKGGIVSFLSGKTVRVVIGLGVVVLIGLVCVWILLKRKNRKNRTVKEHTMNE